MPAALFVHIRVKCNWNMFGFDRVGLCAFLQQQQYTYIDLAATFPLSSHYIISCTRYAVIVMLDVRICSYAQVVITVRRTAYSISGL